MNKILITGGAGFIGSNVAAFYLEKGHTVTLFDNLHRPGVSNNVDWLTKSFPKSLLKVVVGDIRDYPVGRRKCQL